MGMKPGDIFYTDSEAAVLKVDLLAAQAQVVCAGGVLVRPFGIALLPNGDIVVSDTGSLALAVLDGRTGTQRTVPRGDGLGVPFGIAADRHGNVYVANAQVIRKVEKQKEAEAWPTKRHSHEPV
jgi:streptogramin lyase